jgi:tRNA A-37 threonylcarbamoyl transferase component Bud32
MQDESSSAADNLRPKRRASLARRVWWDPDLPRELVETVLRGELDRLLFSSDPLQVKDRCVVARHESAAGPLLVKRHTWGGAWRTVRMAFREPAARRCARLGLYLNKLGIPTPRPRAYVNCRVGPWTYRSYLFSEYIEGESLYRVIRFGEQSADELRHLAEQVAGIWQRLVELGFSHNDLKPENFIVDSDANVWLIDLEKVRIRGKARRQKQRQVFDVRNFLHVRSWHRRAEARAIFAEAFLKTPYFNWLQEAGIDGAAGIVGEQSDTDLSVLVLCNGGIDMRLARQAIDSVRDIADEVVLVEPDEFGRLEVLKRIDVCGTPAFVVPKSTNQEANTLAPYIARFPWVLALQQNESVTPFLAKELQQRIADANGNVALRIALESQYFGRTIAHPKRETPIRLFRQTDCSVQVGNQSVAVMADSDHTGRLTGTILACECATVEEFVERLNEQTTAAAIRRADADEHPQLFRGALRAMWKFLSSCSMRSGWTGLQIAALESVFLWLEEAKLYQRAVEFRLSNSHGDSSVSEAAEEANPEAAKTSWKKAA